jgi:cobalt/nickel transport system permease protein
MSGLHEAGVVGDSPIHRLDPRAKVLGFAGITVVAVSTSAWPIHAACAAALALIAALAHLSPRTIARRVRVVLPALALVACLIPFRGTEVFFVVGAKALVGTFSAVLLGATTPFPDVLHALERLKAPRLLVLIAAFMYRYLFVIADEVHRMRAALAARGYAPRHALQAQAIGRVATALFLRTYERAERVHLAMLARGFSQTMPRMDVLAFRRADVLFLAALTTLLPLRLFA